MSSKTDIANMALSHLGVSDEINDFDTDRTKTAQAARRFYDTTRDEVLRDFDWSFARRRESLALVATDPNLDWAYSYRRPAAALAIRSIPNDAGIRVDTISSRVAFATASDDTGGLLYTDQVDAEIVYTVRVDNEEFYPPDFVAALSYLLAARLGPRVTSGDPKLADRALQLYRIELQKAQANSANEERAVDPEPDAEMIRVRGVGSPLPDADDSWP